MAGVKLATNPQCGGLALGIEKVDLFTPLSVKMEILTRNVERTGVVNRLAPPSLLIFFSHFLPSPHSRSSEEPPKAIYLLCLKGGLVGMTQNSTYVFLCAKKNIRQEFSGCMGGSVS